MAQIVNKMDFLATDYSNLEGTNCFCADDVAEEIRHSVSRLPLNAVHGIGTGDYHYISLFWLERITEPFILLLFDNHPDDQESSFVGGLLSCGNWVRSARSLPLCRAVVWYDGKGVRHETGTPADCGAAYFSIDLDILSKEYARTDWDQGELTLSRLKALLKSEMKSHRILGADICGGLTPEKGATATDIAINSATEETLKELFR